MLTTRSSVSSAIPVRPLRQPPYLEVRTSSFHGLGVFTTRPIKAGARLLEYLGERISHVEAGRRYCAAPSPDPHVLLFTVDRWTVVDGGVGGRTARYVNHSCDPNCEADIAHGRIFITSIRDIAAGEELTYDYNLAAPRPLPRDWRQRYGCRCGAERCRGTMLVRPRRTRRRTNVASTSYRQRS